MSVISSLIATIIEQRNVAQRKLGWMQNPANKMLHLLLLEQDGYEFPEVVAQQKIEARQREIKECDDQLDRFAVTHREHFPEGHLEDAA